MKHIRTFNNDIARTLLREIKEREREKKPREICISLNVQHIRNKFRLKEFKAWSRIHTGCQ